MADKADARGGQSFPGIEDLLVREIGRTRASPADVDAALRFIQSSRGRDLGAFQALPRRLRRLVDLLIAA